MILRTGRREGSGDMGKNSKIEWTNHTFNPWWGCLKVSQACKHCYAEAWAKRVGQQVWGIQADRRFFGEKHWSEPLKWDQEARTLGARRRVFCASMADVFEDRKDLEPWRSKLWPLIEATPNLDWLILTKRPENIAAMVPWKGDWPSNVWMGTTIENQVCARKRLPYLSRVPATVRFISAEPLLGPLDLERWIDHIDWVITGGESGPKARPSSPTWFRDLLRQCIRGDVPFHFKQWGDWAPGGPLLRAASARVQKAPDGTEMVKVGKKLAGRALDGTTHDGLPCAA